MARLSTTLSSAFLVMLSLGCESRAELGSVSPATGAGATGAGSARGCEPLETRAPNASDQRPEFPEQTRACGVRTTAALEVRVLATGLDHPWAVEPMPDGDLLVTERPGRLRIVTAAGETLPPIAGLLPVDAKGQGGLLDVALSPTFATDRTLYWSYSEPRTGGNATSVARATLSADRTRLESPTVIFRSLPTYDGDKHFGSRVLVGPDGKLYVTLGERSDKEMREQAQRLDSHLGKIVRVNGDGSVPESNPFADRPGALPEIWSLGHRNVQAAAFDASGTLWEIEHGTRGGDELNRVEEAGNYGWPVQAYGEEYIGTSIRGAETRREGMISPVYYWDPVIAPSGAEFYRGDAFPEWKGNLFVGALKETRLVRLVIAEGKVTGEEHLLADRKQRIRDVREGPDGLLYIVTDEKPGELWKISPKS